MEGWALAGGFELLLACDMAVAGRGAHFGVPEVKRSLVAGAGAAIHLSRRLPMAVALQLLLTGDPVDAERALALGLVNELTDDGGALDGAIRLAEAVAMNGPLAVAATKRIARENLDWTSETIWARQAEVMGPVFASDDAKEGATAFAEKRPAVWRGR